MPFTFLGARLKALFNQSYAFPASVATWTDDKANSVALTQSTVGKQPPSTTFPDGSVALSFVAANSDFLHTTGLTTGPTTEQFRLLFFAFKSTTSPGADQVLWREQSAGTGDDFAVELIASTGKVSVTPVTAGTAAVSNSSLLADGTLHTVMVLLDNVASVFTLYIDGVAQTTTGATGGNVFFVGSTSDLKIGIDQNGTSSPFNGILGTIGYAWDTATFSGDLASVHSELAAKFSGGVALTPVDLSRYPDTVGRPLGLNHASRMPSTSVGTAPVVVVAAPSLAAPRYPDLFDADPRRRIHASRVPSTTISALPLGAGASTALKAQPPSFPDRIDRPSMHASRQLAAGDMPAFPWLAGASSALKAQPAVFPDFVTRPVLRAERQLAVTSLSPLPERKSPIASTYFPDAIIRPTLRAEQQLATALEPSPIAAASLTPVALADFPDFATRPWFSVAQQLAATAETPNPLGAGASSALLSQPSVYPDTVPRPWFSVANQLAAELAPLQAAATLTPVALTSYPDAPTRALVRADRQMAATEIPAFPLSLSITPYALTWYPAAVTRPAMRPEQQPAATEIAPFPLGAGASSALLFQLPVYPSSVLRPFLRAEVQLAVTSLSPSPIAAATPPLAAVRYPDSITRASMLVAAQLAWATSPVPERTAPAAAALYPDRPTRAAFLTADHLAASSTPPAPEQTSAHDWCVFAPDFVRQTTLATSEHLATALPPQPERTSPLATVHAPERLTRPVFPTALHLAFVGPLRIVVAVASATASAQYPDFARRAWLPASAHPFFTTTTVILQATYARFRTRIETRITFATSVDAATLIHTRILTAETRFASSVQAATAITSRIEPSITFTTQVVPMKLYVGADATVITKLESTTTGLPIEPSALSIIVTPPVQSDGTVRPDVTYTLGVDANVTRVVVTNPDGSLQPEFHAVIDCAYAGRWKFKWSSPGPLAKGTDRGNFDVLA